MLRLLKQLFFFIIIDIVLVVSARSRFTRVETDFGTVEGETVSPDVDGLPPVNQFLGIPYGVPPVEQKRFLMPVSAAKWKDLPKRATRIRDVCPQTEIPDLATSKFTASSRDRKRHKDKIGLQKTTSQRYDFMHRLFPKLGRHSEDCLYMNLYVPANIDPKTTKLPVLVVVHGDEYGWGAGSPYNGTILASFGRIIVVTLNYRLGVFGFLAYCEDIHHACKGDWGALDIVAALSMISKTIEAFGGDRNSVTLLGWGSGAALASFLAISPITNPEKRRLFRRVILLDGTGLAPWAISSNPQTKFFQLAEKLDCYTPVSKNSEKQRRFPEVSINMDKILQCIQDHSIQNITVAVRSIPTATFLPKFAPVVDGRVVHNRPHRSFAYDTENRILFGQVDLLVGLTTHPAHYLLADDFYKKGMTKRDREKIFRTLVRNFYDVHRKEILAAIEKEYTDWNNPLATNKKTLDLVLDALDDALFTAPLIQTARYHADTGPSKTYMLVFAHSTKSQMSEIEEGLRIDGSITGDQIPYIFGYPLWNSDENIYFGFNDIDRSISRVMMRYISNFVISGQPSMPHSHSNLAVEGRYANLIWSDFNQANREPYLEISERPRTRSYYRNAYVGFWNSFIPQLHNTSELDGIAQPDHHHLLHDHFEPSSYYGVVRPYGTYMNDPHPPPPLPPAPPPATFTTLGKASHTTTAKPEQQTVMVEAAVAQNSTMLSVTVAVGCGLLLLNICIGLGLYRQCNNRREENKKKLQLQYQTYAANLHPGGDLNYNLNTPISQQEPLLPVNNKPSVGSAHMRTGVSPTCPRHGRAAMALAAGRASLHNAQSSGPTLEEIQV